MCVRPPKTHTFFLWLSHQVCHRDPGWGVKQKELLVFLSLCLAYQRNSNSCWINVKRFEANMTEFKHMLEIYFVHMSCVCMHACMHVHMYAFVCGEIRDQLQVLFLGSCLPLFLIWSLTGLEYTKQVSLTDQQVQRSACLTSLVLGLQVGPTTPVDFTDWIIAPALIYFILYILIHLYISAKLKFKFRLCQVYI